MKKVPEKCDQVDMRLDEIGKILDELQGCKPGDVPEMAKRLVEAMPEYLAKVKDALEK